MVLISCISYTSPEPGNMMKPCSWFAILWSNRKGICTFRSNIDLCCGVAIKVDQEHSYPLLQNEVKMIQWQRIRKEKNSFQEHDYSGCSLLSLLHSEHMLLSSSTLWSSLIEHFAPSNDAIKVHCIARMKKLVMVHSLCNDPAQSMWGIAQILIFSRKLR